MAFALDFEGGRVQGDRLFDKANKVDSNVSQITSQYKKEKPPETRKEHGVKKVVFHKKQVT